jgi:hypothetical protein
VSSRTIRSLVYSILLAAVPRPVLGQKLEPSKAPKVEFAREVKHGASIPIRMLRTTAPMTHEGESDDGPLPIPLRRVKNAPRRDYALQAVQPRLLAPLTILNFAGLGNGAYGSADDFIPPDTNGSAGLTQYVQWVNGEFAVFSKATGALVQAPVYGNMLWQSFGQDDPCYENNAGDIIAQYDKMANRWVLSQFTGRTGPPFYQCFAVSQTSDATGAYWLYEFAFTDYFNDYPKIGVWPDGYYATFNMYDANNNFQGGRNCVYQRSAMLAGNTATSQCFTLPEYGGMLPSDLDGPTPPPSGAPNYSLGLDGSLAAVDLFSFHVDWVTPANSTLNGPVSLSVVPFTPACYGETDNQGTCVVQPQTSQQLDSLGDRMMYRLAYRNFGDHESLVVNHSVDTGTGNIGVRWYEIHNPSSSPFIYQQSTYAPDTDSRWMGSMVMDHSGNIALGYGVSSSATYPSVRFTGRQSFDTLNTMESETSMVAGAGSQVPEDNEVANRWGDYSSFSVDPIDDCTLWYTHEYMAVTGDYAWSTQIGSLKFGSCQPINLAPAFSVAATPAFFAYQGSSAVITVSTTVQNGFSAALTLSVTGLPAGTTADFSSTIIPAPGNGSVTVTIPILGGTAPGAYSVVVSGTGGGSTESTIVQLTVMTSGAYDAMNDGGFELASATGSSAPGWSGTVSNPQQDLIIFQGPYPHTGTNYASFSGSGGITEADSLTQSISIPAGLNTAELSFWVNITTSVVNASVQDTLAITLVDTNGVSHSLGVLSNLDALSDSNVPGQYFQPSAVSLLPWTGQTVQIIFSSSTVSTTFLVDDVDLNIAGSGAPCAFTLSPSMVYFDANTNSAPASVTANLPYCSWTPGPGVSWITYTSSIGVGSSPFTIGVIPNHTGVARTGAISVGSTSITVTQDATVQVFSDVPPSSYYFDAVDLFDLQGLTDGCTTTTYCPQVSVTRAQMAIFIVRTMLGTGAFPYNPVPYFTDAPAGSFGFEYIQKLWELGVTSGCGTNLFCPNDDVTREQMAVFVIRARYGANTVFDYPLAPYFTDVPMGAFAFNYIQRMKEDNITSGCATTLYCPTDPVIRGDMAIFIMRGGFNDLLPAGEPYLSQLSQDALPNGTSALLTVTGVNTSFVQGTTMVNPMPGVTFGAVTVTTATSLSVPITANASTTPLPVSIWVTTGTEEAVFPNGIQVQ